MSADIVVVKATKVTKTFGAGGPSAVTAVRDVTLELRAGEMVLISGRSGSGKTTLLSMLGALMAPSSGAVDLTGLRLASLSQARLTRLRLESVGFVFQAAHLIDGLSAAENVELPLNLAGGVRPASARRAVDMLTRLGLEGRVHVGARALSGGERQRVAIARAVANDPPLLLADEPTGSLDSHAGLGVIELLHAAAHNERKAVLVVSHDARIREYADRVLTMEDGSLTDAGSSQF
jgi:putative ABC transport system ATP-binding protein